MLRNEFIVSESEQGTRLDVLVGMLAAVDSRSVAARLIEDGLVLVDGQPCAKKYSVRAGERVEIDLPAADATDLQAEDIPLDIRFEDEHLIVLSKPAGLVVHPAQGNWSGTLVNALLHHVASLGTLQGEDRPGIVHRLDKDTTGLMLVAKTDEAQIALQDAIKVRAVDRRYLTLVHGWIAPDSGLVDAALARDPKGRMRMAVSGRPDAKQAVTTFRVLERFEAGAEDDGFTLIECKLYTGRTHQIRVHMAYIKHPCVGDQTYGSGRPKANLGLNRQFLHAYRLEFDHPVTAEHIALVDPLPSDLAVRLAELEPLSMGRTAVADEVLSAIVQEESASTANERHGAEEA